MLSKTAPLALFATLLLIPSAFGHRVLFPSQDGLMITAEVLAPHAEPDTPLIVLCHQAGWSRGEYQELMPRLAKLGFNCIAIDQRSGGAVNDIANETARRAERENKSTNYLDAEQDIIAALEYARTHYAKQGKVIAWGSSYSAALVLRIAGERPELVDGVLAFSPGEYFERFDKPANWIAKSARKIKAPVFITSARDEAEQWSKIYDAIRTAEKARFMPESKGNHGSRALWKQFDDSDAYWRAVTAFLEQFTLTEPEAQPDSEPVKLPERTDRFRRRGL